MSIVVANGLLITEAAYLYSDLIADNPVVPDKVCIFSYTSIDGNGAYVGLKGYIGSNVTFDKLIPIFNNVGSGKLLKSGTMTVDNQFDYTILASDITALTANLIVGQVIVNKQAFPATISYQNYPLSAGDIISLTGLPDMSFVSSLNFLLQ